MLTYTDTQPDSATVSYFVRAHDAAGNQSANSNTVTRTGQTGDTQAPTAPTNLAFTQPASGQIRLTWTASTDNVGVTGYDVYANGGLRASVGGTTLTYTDTQPDTATVSYVVRARDAAGNQSADSNTVTRTGSGTGANLAVGKPITASGFVHTFVATNANDNNVTTYWEANSGAFPNTLTVALGANAVVNQVVLRLNPDPAWGTRTQNIQVLGRGQSASGFTSLAGAANYTFNPASGNAVTIPVSATVADVRLVVQLEHRRPRRAGGRVPGHRHAGAQPGPDRDRGVVEPGLAGRDRRGDAVGDGAQRRHRRVGRDRRGALPRHHQGRHRHRRRARRRRERHRLGQRRPPQRGNVPGDGQGRREQRRDRAQRAEQLVHRRRLARGRSGRQLGPGRRIGGLVTRTTRPAAPP